MSTKTLLVRDLAVNYLWPQYSLPWNNFFRRIDSIPFNIKNELRNITVRQIHSPLTYDSKPVASVGSASTVPVWTQINPLASKPITSSASKVFVGTYFDTAADINGLEYQYDISGSQVFVQQGGLQPPYTGLLYIALNLANRNPATVNIPVGVDTAACTPCGPDPINQTSTYNSCSLSSDNPANNFWSTLTGTVTVNGLCSNGSIGASSTYCLDTAKPYKDSCNNCLSTSTDPQTFYYLFGNRLYLAINVTDITVPIVRVSYQVSIRVVETRTPLDAALDPLFLDAQVPYLLN